MASVKFSGLIAGIKGVVNGSILQSNPAGYVMRTRTNGTRINSQSWQGQKSALAWVAGQWRELSPSDQATFATQAPNYPATDKFGDAYDPSAYQLFMTLNGALYSNGLTMISSAIAPVALTDPLYISISNTWAVSLEFAYGTLVSSDEVIVLYAGPTQSAGTGFRVGSMRRIGQFVAADGNSGIDITNEYAAVFPDTFTVGVVWFMAQIINVNTGQKGRTFTTMFTI